MCASVGSKAICTDDACFLFWASFPFRVAGFLPLAGVDLATAFVFPTLADASSAFLFFATINFLPELRFSHRLRIDKRFVRGAIRTGIGPARTRVGVAATFN